MQVCKQLQEKLRMERSLIKNTYLYWEELNSAPNHGTT